MKKDSLPTEVSKWSLMKRKIRKVLIWFLTLIIIVTGIFIYWKYFYTYSDGHRAGLLQKFSHKGIFLKPMKVK